LNPRVERRNVEKTLLPTECQELVGVDPRGRSFPVQLRLQAVPPGRLISAPGDRDCDDRENHDLEDLDRLVPARLRPIRRAVPTLTQFPCDLDANLVGHNPLLGKSMQVSPSVPSRVAKSWLQ